MAVKTTYPRAMNRNIAAMEADLALGFPPAVRSPVTASCMAWTTDRLCILIHHLAKRLHTGS